MKTKTMKQSTFKTVVIPTLIFTLAILLLSSCKNLVPYTDSLQAERGWTTENVKSAQFFLSEGIWLERKMLKNIPDKIEGKIVIKNGVKMDVIYLPKNMPIVLVDTTETGAYVMQCELGDNKTLNFKVNPNNGKFVLLASEWKDGYGKVHYSNKEFYVSTDEGTVHLLIDLRKLSKVHKKFHKGKGVKVKPNLV